MNKLRYVMLLALLLPLALPGPVAVARPLSELPLDLSGELHGAAYRIVVPENWNGTLLVYARGYSANPTAVEVAFLAEEQLLERGYALASSALRSGGIRLDQFALDLKYLTDFFKQQVAKPEHTVIYGISMGGDLTLRSMEQFPGTYDAGIPLCAAGAGWLRDISDHFSYALAYDAAFGWDPSWGLVEDVRDDIEFYGDVWFYKVMAEFFVPEYPANFSRWEFVRLVNDLPFEDFYVYNGPADMPPVGISRTFFATYQRAEFEVAAGGRVSQNIGYVYSLSDADRAYLQALDPALDLDAMLAQMNAMTGIKADPGALAFVRRIGEFSGRVHGPILMGHTVVDGICRVENTTEYANLMAAAGTQDLLTRVYSGFPGHCNFTEEQMLALFAAMDDWLETGVAPTPDAFPEALGFVHGFEPGPWPQPPQ